MKNEYKTIGYLKTDSGNPNLVECEVNLFDKKDFRPHKEYEEVEIIIRRKENNL